MLIQKLFKDNLGDERSMKTDYELLRHIFLSLFPDILKGFFTNPVTAWRRFSVMVIALSSVTIGYLPCLFKEPPNRRAFSEEQAQI